MAMSDKRILKAIRKGRIVIEPYDERRLSTSSYDVSIGENFYREQDPDLPGGVFNILDPSHVERVWGKKQIAPKLRDTEIGNQGALYGIDLDDQVIILKPNETILAHTEEYIGGRHSITTMMKARSSLGRSGILVCKCAGWGDVGYTTRWTMEITNVLRYNIPLLVGCRVAQIIFMKTGKIRGQNYAQTGAYQKSEDLDEIKRLWTPEEMLPKIRP